MVSVRIAVSSVLTQCSDGFKSLRDSPRDLYLTYFLMVLESFNYFSTSLLFVLYLTQKFGVSDIEAGTLYGLWGTLLVANGIIFSPVIDLIGFRGSLIVCYIINIAGRFVVATTTSKTVLLWTLLGPVTIAGSLGTPVQTIAIKRYTTETNRGFAFSLFYSFMNVAALLCASILDLFRVKLRHGFNIESLPENHFLNDGSRLLLFMGCLTSTVALIVSCFLRSKVELVDTIKLQKKKHAQAADIEDQDQEPLLEDLQHKATRRKDTIDHAAPSQPTSDSPSAVKTSWQSFMADAKDVLVSPETWKFMAMCVITVNLKQIFRHVDATLPKYLIRAYGCDAPVGLVYGINPFMIIFMVPFVGALTTKFAHFDMIHYGSYISALSPFWIVAFPTHEWSAVLFVITLSLGESVWSPRWYDYSMSLAPHGREGIFTALASAPLFAAKLPTGMLSGALLQAYCPDAHSCDSETGQETGELGMCDGRKMWGIIGALTLTSPLLILLTQRWVRPAPKPAVPEQPEEESERMLGAPNTHIAVPVHDFLEDEAVVDGALSHIQEGHRR
ncbi:hypothetical protein COCOBI_09-3080 [Coccomyxa sp. Obi]|nr:hypothetical protein COCOBI_09-3080 [Coccomyxa sp. Obi]